jgi:RNA polymerase sigma-54 factor
MKPSLQLRLSAHLALTPQLQQSIRLLQLSTLELQQEVEQMLEQNPFLDVEEDSVAPPEPLAERLSSAERLGERESEVAVDTQHEASDDAPALDSAEFGTTEREDWENGTERDDFDGVRDLPSNNVSGEHSGEDFDPQERQGGSLSLQDHLRQQLLGMRLSPEDEAALQLVIESVNDDGYLASSLEELAEGLTSSEEEAEALIERLRCALKWLQHMDPLGVGARDLSECLVLQLRAQPRSQAQMIAIIVCKQYLELLAKRDLRKLMLVTGADEDLLRQAQTLITALEPKPGRPFARAEDNIIIPDVIVQKVGRSWRVQLNPDVMPKLRVNDMYANAIKQQRGAANQNTGLSGRLQEARWFVKNIMQRFDTIQRVSQAIVERQKNFFSHGAIAMKPLVLREIADELGLHESTISRVTTAKYMATPFGTFELKYFFGSSLNTEAGGNASSTAVRALIKQLVDAENPKKPLSDSQLSTMLEDQGIQVARRTVAKYREALKIAPANLRKAL